MSARCPQCGSTSVRHYNDGKSHCFECSTHPTPHNRYGRFNPRCALCWADAGSAFIRSLYVCAWRTIRKVGRQVEP